jgi:asparagine synthase (glutamine-hydrolysing)
MAHELTDRRIGAYLSGGTDSGAITGFLSQTIPGPVPVFHASFNDEDEDESHYAKIAARQFGLDLSVRIVQPMEFLDLHDKLIVDFNEPYANPSIVASQMCAEMAIGKGVSVLFAGDGGDEIFGGNERYTKDIIFDWYARIPSSLDALPLSVARLAPDSFFGARIVNFIRRARMENPRRFYSDDEFASKYYDELLNDNFRNGVSKDSSFRVIEAIFNECDAKASINRLLALDLKTTIADNDLVKTGTVGYHSDLLLRYPFLGKKLMDFMGSVPPSLKVSGFKKRVLFKKAMTGFLPDEILRKRKHGMGIPMGRWLREEKPFRDRVLEGLFSDARGPSSFFRTEFLQGLLSRHDRKLWDYGHVLWRIYSLNKWLDYHYGR